MFSLALLCMVVRKVLKNSYRWIESGTTARSVFISMSPLHSPNSCIRQRSVIKAVLVVKIANDIRYNKSCVSVDAKDFDVLIRHSERTQYYEL